MRPSRLLLLPAIVLIALFLAACAKPLHEKNELYVMVATNVDLPYWQEAKAGLDGAALAMGVKVRFVGPSGYNPEEQKRLFSEALQQKPSGMLVSPSDPTLLKYEINAAIKAGIPVICLDSDSPESKRLMFIGTNNYAAGFTGGRMLGEAIHRGKIVILSIPGQWNLDERVRGYQDALKAFPEIKILDVLNDKGDLIVANDVATRAIQKYADLAAIVAVESTGGQGAAEALYRLDIKGKTILAMDANEETLNWIERGMIAATIAQKPYTMSFYGLRFLDDLHHRTLRRYGDWQSAAVSPLPLYVDTGTIVINKNNVAQFLKAIPKPGS